MGNFIGLLTGDSILSMRKEMLRKLESGGGRSKLLLETGDETKELLHTIGSYPNDPYIQHLVLGLMFIRYDSYTMGVSDKKQMAALGTVFESEPNAARRILYWGSLVILYHTFSATMTRFTGKAISRLMSSFLPKPDSGNETCA